LLLKKSILKLLAIQSITSILSRLDNSQGLALNAYGFDVNAPTGHKSIILADNSSTKEYLMNVPISLDSPRPNIPKSFVPETSDKKRTHLVQCTHLVINIFTKGPQSLSKMALLLYS